MATPGNSSAPSTSAAMATTPGAAFRAKTTEMKSWRPANPPSNRDRLELYALHKQAVSGDAPPLPDPPTASVADKTKLHAWRTKRGLSQGEAMAAYSTECDRQMRVYGTKTNPPSSSSGGTGADATNGGGGSGAGANGGTGGDGTTPASDQCGATPRNTPAAGAAGGSSSQHSEGDDGDNHNGDALLFPRGLAAVPLLCAAASESRGAYLARLKNTRAVDGWWARQEPLCAEPGTPSALPEAAVIGAASKVEGLSLKVGSPTGTGTATEAASQLVPTTVVQSFLWPVHNALLAVWIGLVFVSTLIGSATLSVKTILLGSRRTGAPLARILQDEVVPCARSASSLCDRHQALSVRLVGLALLPLAMLCDLIRSVSEGNLPGGELPAMALYVFAAVMTWWYWLCVLPWAAVWLVGAALGSGCCFALIELAGV